jgi:fatty-acyl-CoA synthase
MTAAESMLSHPSAAADDLVGTLAKAAETEAGYYFYSGRGELIESLPYARLIEQARHIARCLLSCGLKPGDRVGLLAETDGDFVRSFFGCQLAGLVPAPLPLPVALGGRSTYLHHIRCMLESIGASAVLAPDAFDSWMAEASQGLTLTFQGTLAALMPLEKEAVTLPQTSEEGLAYLQFSSGSTRFPHAIAVTHRAVIANLRGIGQHGLKVTASDRMAAWLPFYHDMGLVGFVLTPMACGVSVDLMATRDFARRPLTWLQLISHHGATISYSPSFGYELCARRVENGVPEGLDLSRWRVAGIGGDMVRPAPLRKFASAFSVSGFDARAFMPSYGMAEAALALSFSPLGRGLAVDAIDNQALEGASQAVDADTATARQREFVRCGPILPGHEVEVRSESGAQLPENGIGRIFVRGPSLMQAYFNEPEATAAALTAGGWLDTGDLGYLRTGEIVITGRAKDLIIINGRNIRPQDLEWTAEGEVDGLRSGDVAAFAVDDVESEAVVVLVESRASDSALRDRLTEAVTGVLRARHGVETRVVIVPPRSLPQTSSGKLARAKAKALYLSGQFGASGA